jgi:hypothetical protein
MPHSQTWLCGGPAMSSRARARVSGDTSSVRALGGRRPQAAVRAAPGMPYAYDVWSADEAPSAETLRWCEADELCDGSMTSTESPSIASASGAVRGGLPCLAGPPPTFGPAVRARLHAYGATCWRGRSSGSSATARRSASSNVIVCTSNGCAPDGSVTTVGTASPSTSGRATPASTGVTTPIHSEDSHV